MSKSRNNNKKTNKVHKNNTSFENAVFEIASAFMNGSKSSVPEIDDKNFNDYVEKLREHKLLPLAAFVMSDTKISEPNCQLLKSEALAQIMFQENKNSAFLKAYKAMISAGAKPICVKGCVCEALWSIPSLRISGDADIIASGKDFCICSDVLQSLGFSISDDNSNDEKSFIDKNNGCKIELHSSPFSDDSFASDFNNLLEDLSLNTSSVIIDGVEVLCPSVQKHLIYVVLHAFKHFIIAGVGIRQLMDISLISMDESIDWKIVFEKCSLVSADGFLNAVLLICNKYFGLDISRIDSPLFDSSLDCELMLDDIKQGGIYGSVDSDRQSGGNLTRNSYSKSQNGEHYAYIFLPLKDMKKRYPYLRRFPFLLPFAWIQRIFRFLFSDNKLSESVASGKARENVMKYYRIVK